MPQIAVSASEIYARCLLSHCHGYALWIPEPYGEVAKYGSVGVRIGDVGYITDDGAFEGLFNVRAGADNPLQRYGVPRGFEPAGIEEGHIQLVHLFHPPGAIASKAASKKVIGGNIGASQGPNLAMLAGGSAGFEYNWSSSSGAILHLPNGSHRRNLPPEYLKDYAIRHAQSWYEFANSELHRGVPPETGSIFVVTGYDKTNSWMVGAFSGITSGTTVSLKANALGAIEGQINFQYDWGNQTSPAHRIGPADDRVVRLNEATNRPQGAIDSPGVPLQTAAETHIDSGPSGSPDVLRGCNQCIFVRGWYITVARKFVGTKRTVKVATIENLKPSEVVRRSIKSLLSEGGCSGADSASGNVHTPVAGSGSVQASSSSTNDSDTLTTSDGPVDGVQIEYLPNIAQRCHPCKILNEFLLQTAPGVTIALSHDDDWCFLGKAESSFPWEELESYVRVVDGVAFFTFLSLSSGYYVGSTVAAANSLGVGPGAQVSTEVGSVRSRLSAGDSSYCQRLENWAQGSGYTVSYHAVPSGPKHRQQWQAIVSVSGAQYGTGWGASKDQAKEVAALSALTSLGLLSKL